MPSMPQGVTSASLIVIILTACAIGALVGGLLGPDFEPAPLALIAGFVATVVAVVVRNKLLYRFSGVGPDDARIPRGGDRLHDHRLIAGSLASKEILDQFGGASSPVWTGTLAGLGSAILMSLLMITYHMYPDRSRG